MQFITYIWIIFALYNAFRMHPFAYVSTLLLFCCWPCTNWPSQLMACEVRGRHAQGRDSESVPKDDWGLRALLYTINDLIKELIQNHSSLLGKGRNCGGQQVVEGVPLKGTAQPSLPLLLCTLLQSELYILGKGFTYIMVSQPLCVASSMFLRLSQGFLCLC